MRFWGALLGAVVIEVLIITLLKDDDTIKLILIAVGPLAFVLLVRLVFPRQ